MGTRARMRAALLAAGAVAAGCSSSGAGRALTPGTASTTSSVPSTAPPGPTSVSPTTSGATTVPVATTTPPTVPPSCPPAPTADRTEGGPVLAAAALLSATVQVDGGPAGRPPTCTTLAVREVAVLHIGDRVQFQANSAPQLQPASPQVVQVSTAPLPPTTTGPGGLQTSHVEVTLTAVATGTVKVTWVNCSGTGC